MNKHKFLYRYALIGVAIALAIPLTVYAAHLTINTNDGIVDPNWASVTLFGSDGDDWADDNYDIDQTWVTNAADNSFFYFRANLIGSGRLPSSDNWSSIEAHLDCDTNGDDYGASDVIAIYYGQDNSSIECQGTAWPNCAPGPGSADWNDNTTAEEISGTPNNYEWQADVNNGNVNWSACLSTVNIRFVTLDSNGAVADTTEWRPYNAPTAVTLEKFSAGQLNDTFILPIALVSLLAVLTAASKVLAHRWSVQNS